jgi:hypothetical protein
VDNLRHGAFAVKCNVFAMPKHCGIMEKIPQGVMIQEKTFLTHYFSKT